MKLKTLKGTFTQKRFEVPNTGIIERDLIEKLKELSIKCVKEDKETTIRLPYTVRRTWEISTKRWMERLNITEEDLE